MRIKPAGTSGATLQGQSAQQRPEESVSEGGPPKPHAGGAVWVVSVFGGFSACAVIALVIALRMPNGLPLGPAIVPVVAAVSILGLGLTGLIGVAVTRRAAADEEWVKIPAGRAAAAAAMLLAYALFVSTVGFVVGTLVLAGGLMVVGYRSVIPPSAARKDALGLAILVAFLYFSFIYLLHVTLP